MSLERGPHNLVRITEEIFQGNSGSGQENRDNGRGDPLRWPRGTLYLLKLALTSPTSGGCSVGIVADYRPRCLYQIFKTNRFWENSKFRYRLHLNWWRLYWIYVDYK
jgi:hypothetical protein